MVKVPLLAAAAGVAAGEQPPSGVPTATPVFTFSPFENFCLVPNYAPPDVSDPALVKKMEATGTMTLEECAALCTNNAACQTFTYMESGEDGVHDCLDITGLAPSGQAGSVPLTYQGPTAISALAGNCNCPSVEKAGITLTGANFPAQDPASYPTLFEHSQHQPAPLSCWPKNKFGQLAPSPAVVYRSNQVAPTDPKYFKGWCTGMVKKELASGMDCQKDCVDDAGCNGYQLVPEGQDRDPGCFQGAGYDCDASDEAVGSMQAERYQRGYIKKIADITKYQIIGLKRRFSETTYVKPVAAPQRRLTACDGYTCQSGTIKANPASVTCPVGGCDDATCCDQPTQPTASCTGYTCTNGGTIKTTPGTCGATCDDATCCDPPTCNGYACSNGGTVKTAPGTCGANGCDDATCCDAPPSGSTEPDWDMITLRCKEICYGDLWCSAWQVYGADWAGGDKGCFTESQGTGSDGSLNYPLVRDETNFPEKSGIIAGEFIQHWYSQDIPTTTTTTAPPPNTLLPILLGLAALAALLGLLAYVMGWCSPKEKPKKRAKRALQPAPEPKEEPKPEPVPTQPSFLMSAPVLTYAQPVTYAAPVAQPVTTVQHQVAAPVHTYAAPPVTTASYQVAQHVPYSTSVVVPHDQVHAVPLAHAVAQEPVVGGFMG